MTIIVFADRPAHDLAPATRLLPAALLPVGGRPIIDTLLEALSLRGVRDVTVVVPRDAAALARHLRQTRWPMLNQNVVPAAPRLAETDTLTLRGDMWISPRVLDQALAAHDQGMPRAGGWLMHGVEIVEKGKPLPSWYDVVAAIGARAGQASDLARAAMTTIIEYHRLAIAAANEEIRGLTPAGWREADGVRAGLDARVLTRYRPGAGVLVGARAFVDHRVQLGDGVVIGDDCVVAAGARLENCVILPGTRIPSGVRIRNAVVAGSQIARVDLGTIVELGDRFVTGGMAA